MRRHNRRSLYESNLRFLSAETIPIKEFVAPPSKKAGRRKLRTGGIATGEDHRVVEEGSK